MTRECEPEVENMREYRTTSNNVARKGERDGLKRDQLRKGHEGQSAAERLKVMTHPWRRFRDYVRGIW